MWQPHHAWYPMPCQLPMSGASEERTRSCMKRCKLQGQSVLSSQVGGGHTKEVSEASGRLLMALVRRLHDKFAWRTGLKQLWREVA